MIMLIVAVILFAVPFLMLDLFFDKKTGFIYVLFFLFLFQSVLGLLTQALGIFYYWVIFGYTLLADLILVFIYFKKSLSRTVDKEEKKSLSLKSKLNSLDWVVLFVALVSILSLYQVHYNYNGKINSSSDQTVSYHEVNNMVYPYPYFSDEWYAVSLVEGAINNHSLPVRNILSNTFFPNLELFFHSFIAEIMLLFGLNPLLQYTILSIFLNTVIVLLIYLFLRINDIPKLISGICSLSALYVVSGANFPGIWDLIPLTLGIIFFLFGLCFMKINDYKMVLLSVVASMLFYLPLIPFSFTALLVFLLQKTLRTKSSNKHLLRIFFKTGLFLFFAFLFFYLISIFSAPSSMLRFSFYYMSISSVLSKIFFTSLTAPFMSKIYFYNILPIPVILLALFGAYYMIKNKKWILLSELALGAIYYIIYAFTTSRFFIEYERVAVFTSFIIVIFSGFGLWRIEEYIARKFKENSTKILKITEIIILLAFLVLVPSYTRGEGWRSIVLIDPESDAVLYPKAPANNYLVSDDLRIFKNIKNKKFLSLPWKGTVIGVATGNYPILTKQGTISISDLGNNVLNDFFNGDCKLKEDIAKKGKLDYIYIYEFNCPGFQKIDKSQEGLILYEVNKN